MSRESKRGRDDESRLTEMLESVMSGELTEAEIVGAHPELKSELSRRLRAVKELESHIDELFPSNPWRGYRPEEGLSDLPEIEGYRIEAIIGRGGMGVVYKAHHIALNRTVAIKMLLSGRFAERRDLMRFKREAESIANLCHPNIVQVFDAGDCDRHPYFAMEYIGSGTLADALVGVSRPPRWAAEQVSTLARAIELAHTKGVVHRDLKPSNILVATDGTLKIADFGLAQHSRSEEDSTQLTALGARLGTPSYMAPEQVLGGASSHTPSVDIHALGVLLYEMLSGHRPYRGETTAETQQLVVESEPVSLRKRHSRVPRDLETICMKCLRKQPGSRYPSASALADDLDRFLSGRPIFARPVSAPERFTKLVKRHPAHSLLVLFFVLAAVTSVSVGIWIQRVENSRIAESLSRQSAARASIESAINQASELRSQSLWNEASLILHEAQNQLPDARSDSLRDELNLAGKHLALAREFADIRSRYPEAGSAGYTFEGAALRYEQAFESMGIGPDIQLVDAADRVRMSPINAETLAALDNAAFIARVYGHQEEIERYLAIARLADPDEWRDRFRTRQAWYERETLVQLIDEALQNETSQPTRQIVIASVLLGSFGENDKTIETLREALLHDPDDYWINHELSNAYYRKGEIELACQFQRAAVSLQPDNATAWTSLALLLRLAGYFEDSVIAARRAIECDRLYATAWQHLIFGLCSLRLLDDAEEAIRRAEQTFTEADKAIDFSLTSLHILIARGLAAEGRWAESSDRYFAHLELASMNSEFLFELAATSLLSGNRNRYESTLLLMLTQTQAGTGRPYLAARATTLTTNPPSILQEAIDLSSAELSESPGMHWSLVQQGAFAFHGGDLQGAIQLLEQSLEVNQSPGSTIVGRAWLALVYAHSSEQGKSLGWITSVEDQLNEWEWSMPMNSQSIELHLHNWLETMVLYTELRSKVNGKSSSPST